MSTPTNDRDPGEGFSWKHLSSNRQKLLLLVRSIGFGRIERMAVQNGQPIVEPTPRIVRTLKMDRDNTCDTTVPPADFPLRREFINFFEHLENVRDGLVLRVEVVNGLPNYIELEESPAK